MSPLQSPLPQGAGFGQVKVVGSRSEPRHCLWGDSTHPAVIPQRTHALPPTSISGPGNRGLCAWRQGCGRAPRLCSLPSARRKQDALLHACPVAWFRRGLQGVARPGTQILENSSLIPHIPQTSRPWEGATWWVTQGRDLGVAVDPWPHSSPILGSRLSEAVGNQNSRLSSPGLGLSPTSRTPSSHQERGWVLRGSWQGRY